ncbi:MAG TPA: hypothetical protein VFN25_01485 [Dokdonella sp.]|uniref:hypothetical protein n=1 Tax=Dokdonella sp. TaxID=2291710 RepID=UPI002D7E52B2|nr:hypothetical protein [Dokdonella sp.]HET9031555.1 hypothetical protein [Dokdonella sp.]
MTLTQPQRLGIFIVLALVMAGTRINHFSALPDASWAVFFLAGFYLRGSMRWAFPALMALAVGIDVLVISSQGLSFWSHYCVSAAYWFLIAAYAAMWFGGSLLRAHMKGQGLRTLGLLGLSLVAAASVCFVISNGSFYWLSDSVVSPSMSGWMQNMADWYVPYLRTSAMYVCIAVAAHVIVARWLNLPGEQAAAQARRG